MLCPKPPLVERGHFWPPLPRSRVLGPGPRASQVQLCRACSPSLRGIGVCKTGWPKRQLCLSLIENPVLPLWEEAAGRPSVLLQQFCGELWRRKQKLNHKYATDIVPLKSNKCLPVAAGKWAVITRQGSVWKEPPSHLVGILPGRLWFCSCGRWESGGTSRVKKLSSTHQLNLLVQPLWGRCRNRMKEVERIGGFAIRLTWV